MVKQHSEYLKCTYHCTSKKLCWKNIYTACDFLVASFVITKKCKHLKVYQRDRKRKLRYIYAVLRTVQSLKRRVPLFMIKDAKGTLLNERSGCRTACATSHCTWTIPAWNISQSVNKRNTPYTIIVIKYEFGMKERGLYPFPTLYIPLFCVLFFSQY